MLAGTSSNKGRIMPHGVVGAPARRGNLQGARVVEGVLLRVKSFIAPTTHQLGGADRVGIQRRRKVDRVTDRWKLTTNRPCLEYAADSSFLHYRIAGHASFLRSAIGAQQSLRIEEYGVCLGCLFS
jgi:hypothetical protein